MARHARPVIVFSGKAGAGMILEEIVVTAVAAVCGFVAVLVLVLRRSARRRVRRPGGWEQRAWSFGPKEDGEYGGAPGYGRPPGYRPPPLWTDSPYD